MIKIENEKVYGFEAAVRGMRNPMNSWDKSDSEYKRIELVEDVDLYEFVFTVGDNDLKLMKTLAKAGNDHGKFLRMINVTLDITAPLYWWKEFDTYKVGTVANSCSTMHKILSKEFELNDFSYEHLNDESRRYLQMVIDRLEANRKLWFALEGDEAKAAWWQIIQSLPSSYNQKRTVQFNYQVLKTMYFARRNHKLDEWHTLCDWMEKLPYFKEVCLNADNNN